MGNFIFLNKQAKKKEKRKERKTKHTHKKTMSI